MENNLLFKMILNNTITVFSRIFGLRQWWLCQNPQTYLQHPQSVQSNPL